MALNGEQNSFQEIIKELEELGVKNVRNRNE